MINKAQTVVIIPARGGSSRFPGKNLAPLGGKPLIAYPIEAAKKASLIERVIVSTDSGEIARVAKGFGAEIMMRPAELATDTSPVVETVKHVLRTLKEKESFHADYAMLLQAATPLIEPTQIDTAIQLALEKEADSIVNVSEVDTADHPYNVREMLPDGTVRFWQEEKHYTVTGKDRPKFYKAANLWLSSYDTIMKEGKLEGKRNYPVVVAARFASDIDTKEDLGQIEALLSL
jgi:CMP-N-acetylneuraminic acid synthetase